MLKTDLIGVGLFLSLLVSSVRLPAVALRSSGPEQAAAPAKPEAAPWPPPGVYLPGKDGVTLPRVVHQVKPQYTSDAVRAKLQGTVLLECVALMILDLQEAR
jgi:hypothetical protein